MFVASVSCVRPTVSVVRARRCSDKKSPSTIKCRRPSLVSVIRGQFLVAVPLCPILVRTSRKATVMVLGPIRPGRAARMFRSAIPMNTRRMCSRIPTGRLMRLVVPLQAARMAMRMTKRPTRPECMVGAATLRPCILPRLPIRTIAVANIVPATQARTMAAASRSGSPTSQRPI